MKDAPGYARLAVLALAGIGLGAIAMYLLDPASGRIRRERARERALGAAGEAAEAVRRAARDLRGDFRGAASAAVSNVIQWKGPERRTRPRDVE